jgi:hypothetical protein
MSMDTYVCPKGHASTEADYCSECGAKMISPPAAEAVSAVASTAGPAVCPACGAACEGSGLAFCEVCGCDFASAPRPAAGAGSVSAPPVSGWMVTLSVDPTLRTAASPEAPTGVVPATIQLRQPVSLIGRQSEARAIFPEIPIAHDDAVSHRHALLQLFASGVLLLRDIGAANGTRLNGREVEPLVDHPLKDGDEITLGHWSRITVKAVY